MVLLGEMRQVTRILFTFTRPYFGTAKSMSKTLAVSRYSGGFFRRSWMDTRPAFRSLFSCARRVRIWFARCRASMRWTRDRSGAAECFVGEFVAGGMGGDYTSREPPCKPTWANSAQASLEVETRAGWSTP